MHHRCLRWVLAAGIGLALIAMLGAPLSRGQEVLPPVPNPDGRDLYELDLDGIAAYSQMSNFEIVGHSYLRGPWLAPGARGAGINTPRVYNGIAYLSGYNSPPTMFGTLIVDVHDPRNLEPLAFLPGNVGTRT